MHFYIEEKVIEKTMIETNCIRYMLMWKTFNVITDQ